MDKRVFVGLLYDFYGELLTEKQKRIFESHYLEDLSLCEIGEINGISKQAVSDMIKRTERQLNKYEERLRLADRFLKQKRLVKEALDLLEAGEKEKVKEVLIKIID